MTKVTREDFVRKGNERCQAEGAGGWLFSRRGLLAKKCPEARRMPRQREKARIDLVIRAFQLTASRQQLRRGYSTSRLIVVV